MNLTFYLFLLNSPNLNFTPFDFRFSTRDRVIKELRRIQASEVGF